MVNQKAAAALHFATRVNRLCLVPAYLLAESFHGDRIQRRQYWWMGVLDYRWHRKAPMRAAL